MKRQPLPWLSLQYHYRLKRISYSSRQTALLRNYAPLKKLTAELRLKLLKPKGIRCKSDSYEFPYKPSGKLQSIGCIRFDTLFHNIIRYADNRHIWIGPL